MKKILALLVVFIISISSVLSVEAANGKVTYEGDAQKFIFEPGSEYSLSDLFPNFKDVMPGDSLTQKITVKNDASKKVKVKIYMRSLGAHKKSVDFLSQMNLKVAKSSDNEMAYMFDAAADETSQLTDWVKLGTLYSGGKVNLDVTLDVPVEMPNEFQEQVGYLDWEFKVEEFPIEKDDPKPPKTGDDTNFVLWIGLLVVSLVLIIVLIVSKKKKKQQKVYKKIAMILSLCALVAWGMLGMGTSLAWFSDTSPEINNIFHFADFELEVSHRLEDGTWEKVDSKTKIFDDEALYEPGYTQTVFLKVENKGDRDFQFNTAVNVTGYTLATNVYGQRFNLQDYLMFGLTTAATESAMDAQVPDRETAKSIATMKLNNYATDDAILEAGGTSYITLIVHMPEEVNNVANYRGETVPKVELGIIVKASQLQN